MGDILDSLAHQFFLGIAQHVAEFLVDIQHHAIKADAVNSDRGLLQGLVKPPLVLARRLLRLCACNARAQVGDAVCDIAG